MKIYISAGHHDNPVHRKKLENLLRNLKTDSGKPKFIAVEAHEILFKVVIQNQRNQFVKLAKKDDVLQKIDSVLLRNLSKALSYEADTHEDVFNGEVETVWLDNDRRDFSMVIDPCTMAARYMTCCRSAVHNAGIELTRFLREHLLFDTVGAFLESEVEKGQLNINNAPAISFDRDKAWMTMLKKYVLDSGPSAYGIVIVGSDHAQDKPDYIRYLLSKAGNDCEVFLLNN